MNEFEEINFIIKKIIDLIEIEISMSNLTFSGKIRDSYIELLKKEIIELERVHNLIKKLK